MLNTNTPAVVLGRSPTALYIIRELGRAGIKVCSVGMQSHTANWSSYLQHNPATLNPGNEEECLSLLLQHFGKKGKKAFLIASSDQDLDFIYRNIDVLSANFYIQTSILTGQAHNIMDKEQLYQLCIEKGIAVPGSWSADAEKLNDLLGSIQFPCLIKPSLMHEVKTFMAGKKLWTATNNENFKAITATLPRGKTPWLVQEIIPGPESEIWLYCAFFDKHSKPQQAFTARKIRQFPPGFGSASLVQSEDNQELSNLCEQFFTSIKYQGIAAAELKRDAKTGQLKMIEINPRPSLWFEASSAANKQISLAAYCEASDQNLPQEQPQQQGVYWRYWLKDTYSRIFYKLNPGFILPAPVIPNLNNNRSVGAVYARDDVKPAYGELHNLLRKLLQRITAKVTKK